MTLFCPFNCVRACKHQIIWKSHPTTADFIQNEKAVNAAAVNEKVEKVKEVVGGGGRWGRWGERRGAREMKKGGMEIKTRLKKEKENKKKKTTLRHNRHLLSFKIIRTDDFMSKWTL